MTDSQSELPDQPSTIAAGGKRRWIYPTEVVGKWQRLRWVTSFILLVVLYATPWIRIGDAPLLKLSFLSSSFVMFGSHILIYEFYHFALLALLLVVTLFAASALYGRIWCGYACPQTVFIEQILGRVDRFFEGPAAKRLADSHRPMTFARLLRRVGKHLTYLAIAFSFSFTLVAIFTGPELILSGSNRSASVWWALGLLWAVAYFDAAYLREQFCHLICPYARFQGVMQDLATRTIGYDRGRGEPRGRARKDQDPDAVGDCIDCGLCVRVCPSAIDIRQGATQLECVACAKCIDACDGVMQNLGRRPGLIRYDSLAVFSAEAKSATPIVPSVAPKMLRPRVAIYAVLWFAIFSIGVYQFLDRVPFHARIFGTPGAKPWFMEGQRIKNLMTLKIGNQSSEADRYTISLAGIDGAKIESPVQIGPIVPGKEMTIPLLVSLLPTSNAKGEIVISSELTGRNVEIRHQFVVPRQPTITP